MSDETLAAALKVAYRYAEYAPRTEAEVRRRLLRAGVEQEDTDEAVASLQRAGLLDDARFAADWVESRARGKNLGPARLEAELRRKSVDDELIQQALIGDSPEAILDRAQAEARRFLRGATLDDQAQRNRLSGRLHRLGYDWDTIRQVIAALAANITA